MPKCLIDGREVEFKAGENLVEVAKKIGIEIPVFCYHPGMTVVAQCRMCTVEIEKMAKLQTACSTPATDGMVVKTQSEAVKQNRASVMEFLLINHPLDCPICDKSGECDLQDHSYKYGNAYMRYTEERRTYLDLDMGPVIKKNMNRCIHCTRCIRFGQEVAGIHEMVALQRGNNTEITTIDGRPLETDYAANYADICPTGSLTLKDFRFHKRAWFLKKTETICEGCSKGCNMEIHQDANVIYRCLPKVNMEINRYWLCDEGRFNFHYVHSPHRILQPAVKSAADLELSTWPQTVVKARQSLEGKKISVLMGSDLTLEEMQSIKTFVGRKWPDAELYHFGTPGILAVKDDAPADKILKRKSKTSNLNGAEQLGLKGFTQLPSGTSAVVVFRGGRAVLPKLSASTLVGIGVFEKDQAQNFTAILPGLTFAEKEGTLINYEGREQCLKRAIVPPRGCKSLSEILMLWENSSKAAGAA